jgi:hypothetical protein
MLYNLNLGTQHGQSAINMEPAYILEAFKEFFQAAARE